MSKYIDKLRLLWRWLQGYISASFIAMFCISFVLWYVVKLGGRYTTDFTATLNIGDEQLRVPCVVEGVGTNLLASRAKMRRGVKVELSELKYMVESVHDEQTGEITDSFCIIDQQSLHNLLSVRFSDIKIVSIGDVPPMALESKSDNE